MTEIRVLRCWLWALDIVLLAWFRLSLIILFQMVLSDGCGSRGWRPFFSAQPAKTGVIINTVLSAQPLATVPPGYGWLQS